VLFQKFFALRARLESAYLRGARDSVSCAGVDSALIAQSGLPMGAAINRFAACDQGYMVYTTDPAVAPPNLGSVQELAVGIVRVDSATGSTPIAPSDTLEVWVDDIRLTDVVSEVGFAGQVGLTMALGDLATFRISATKRDPNFRQLTELPSFATNNDLDVSATFRLDQLLPPRLGLALPLTIAHTTATVDPTFLAQFAPGGGDQIFALVDPALRHLPEIALAVVDPPADEDVSIGIDQHDADAGTIGKFREIAHAPRFAGYSPPGHPNLREGDFSWAKPPWRGCAGRIPLD
jgi:hypothetical protein